MISFRTSVSVATDYGGTIKGYQTRSAKWRVRATIKRNAETPGESPFIRKVRLQHILITFTNDQTKANRANFIRKDP